MSQLALTSMSVVSCGHLSMVYLFIIIVMLPSALGNSNDNEELLFDSIVQIVRLGATVSQVCYLFCSEMKMPRECVYQNRRCVSEILSDLGKSYTRRFYRMTKNEFWMLYNLIQLYYPLHHNKSFIFYQQVPQLPLFFQYVLDIELIVYVTLI